MAEQEKTNNNQRENRNVQIDETGDWWDNGNVYKLWSIQKNNA